MTKTQHTPRNTKNLRKGDLITVSAKHYGDRSGYDGHAMRFLAQSGPFIFVKVDCHGKRDFTYQMAYRKDMFDVYTFPMNAY